MQRLLPLIALVLACPSTEPEERVETVEVDVPAKVPAREGTVTESQRVVGGGPEATPANPPASPEPLTPPPLPAPSTPTTHAAPEAGGAPAATVGSWVRYRLDWRAGGRSFTEYRLVGREGDTLFIEVTDHRDEGTQHVRLEVVPNDGPAGHRLVGLAFKNTRGIERVPQRLLATFGPMLQQWLGMLFPGAIEGGERETVEVPAGTFEGSAKVPREMSYQGVSLTADVWLHPAVPLTGMVRFMGRGEGGQPSARGGHQLELLAFGSRGAESVFD